MRLNLGCGADIRSGHINVDRIPQGDIPKETYRQGDMSSLDWLVEDGTVDEIIANDSLEYLTLEVIEQAIGNWANKLVKNGVLKILVPDCYAIAQAFTQGQLDLEEYAELTFGTQDANDRRMAVIDSVTLIGMLQKSGLAVSLKRYEGVAFYVEATK